MRFSKACIEPLSYPLLAVPDTSKGLVSPCTGENYRSVPVPTMPEDGEAFYNEAFEVVKIREQVVANVWPSWFFRDHDISEKSGKGDGGISSILYDHGGIRDAQSAASAVHMDQPIDLGIACLKWCNERKIPFKSELHAGGHVDFLANPVGVLSKLSINIEESLKEAFEVKYYFGRPRPEEVTGFGNKFTHYPEGCPAHPAYPAGHAAVAGATYATLVDFFDMSESQRRDLEIATKQFCQYRVLAGVHYASDGIGWDLGVAVSRDLSTVAEVTP